MRNIINIVTVNEGLFDNHPAVIADNEIFDEIDRNLGSVVTSTLAYKSSDPVKFEWPIEGDDILVIDQIEATKRFKGAGTKMMKTVCDICDKHGVSIYLDANSYGGGLGQGALVAFYRKFGFQRFPEMQDFANYPMLRKPRAGTLSEDTAQPALPEKVGKAFKKLGDDQRGRPEFAMLKVQEANGGGVLNGVVEHVGDLTHRMSEYAYRGFDGYEYVADKVTKTLRWLTDPYGFEREHQQNIRANAQHLGVPPEEVKANVDAALAAYAKEHSKLVVYNRAQSLARRAAVSVGKQDWSDAILALGALSMMLDSPEDWRKHAFAYKSDDAGNPIPY